MLLHIVVFISLLLKTEYVMLMVVITHTTARGTVRRTTLGFLEKCKVGDITRVQFLLPAMEDPMVIDGVMYYTAKEIALTTFTLGLLIAFAIIGVLLLLREVLK